MDGWSTHNWITQQPREVIVAGKAMEQHLCLRCYRDFAKERTGKTWHAVNVKLLSFQRLDDEVTQRWTLQGCPGTLLPTDANDRRSVRAETVAGVAPQSTAVGLLTGGRLIEAGRYD